MALLLCEQPDLAADGGILVQGDMQTSISDVYAAGDVCTAGWPPAAHWMQVL
jgi:thioredoxin reductase